jgi:para-nitrobenzyl esterase
MKKLTPLLPFICIINLVLLVSFKEVQTGHIKQVLTDTVRIETGLISGVKTNDRNVRVFKGIPFAAPPVGNLRWKEPQPALPWKGVKECVAFSASPAQPKPAAFSMWSEEFLIPTEPINEDCLYLNVWTGSKSKTEKRPVLVWIYGGGFSSGGSAVPIYDGEAMARKGIVFVSFNYRVGVFGFMAHPGLTKESPTHSSGNYGLLDQIAALKWVQKNITSFGGDVNNVTIAGQSAGSMSVNCLVASPIAKGLFRKAIAQSGASVLGGGKTLQQAEQDGEKVGLALKANSIAELRQKTTEEIQKVGGRSGVIIDGYVLPEAIANIFASGKENKVDLLTGWNEDEGLLFGPIKNASDYVKQAEQQYGSDKETFLKFYPAVNDAEAASSQLKVSRDMTFGVQNYSWANIQSARGTSNVYVYRFKRKVPATGDYLKYGAFHTGEVPYAYDNLKFVNRPWLPVDHELATIMSSYWANFAKTGNPNGKGFPVWPAYKPSDKKIMMFTEKSFAEKLPDEDALNFIYVRMSSK